MFVLMHDDGFDNHAPLAVSHSSLSLRIFSDEYLKQSGEKAHEWESPEWCEEPYRRFDGVPGELRIYHVKVIS